MEKQEKRIWEKPSVDVLSIKTDTARNISEGAYEYFSNENNPGDYDGPAAS